MFRPGRRAFVIAMLALATVSLTACGGLPQFGGFTHYAPYGARYGGPAGRGAAPAPFGSGWNAGGWSAGR